MANSINTLLKHITRCFNHKSVWIHRNKSEYEICISPFFCVMFCCRQKTYNVMKQKWFNFVRSQLVPLNSCKKIKVFSTIGLIAPIENIIQNIGENIVQWWFYETSIKILRLISKSPPPLLLICRQNYNKYFVKPIL